MCNTFSKLRLQGSFHHLVSFLCIREVFLEVSLNNGLSFIGNKLIITGNSCGGTEVRAKGDAEPPRAQMMVTKGLPHSSSFLRSHLGQVRGFARHCLEHVGHMTTPHECAKPRNTEFLPAAVKDVCQ